MAQIPDLSKLNSNKPPEPDTEEKKPTYRTAFSVLVDANGNIQVSSDVPDIEVDHQASHDEIWSACQLIIKDITVQQTAGLVQGGLLQMGSMMQQAQVDQQLRNRLNLK